MKVSVLIWISLFIEEGTPTTPFTEYLFLTHYEASVNDAANICRGRGLDMLKMDTTETLHALTVFFTNSTLAIREQTFWTGLHAPSCNGPCWYRWADCTPLSSPTFWKATSSKEKCVSVHSKELIARSDVWIIDKCKSVHSIICQKTARDCYEFQQFSSYIHLSSPLSSTVLSWLISGNLTKDMCQMQCINSETNDMDCLGFSLFSGQCTLYFSEAVSNIWSHISDTTHLYVKFCYSAVVEDDIVKPEVFKDILEPIRLCPSNITQYVSIEEIPEPSYSTTFDSMDVSSLSLSTTERMADLQTSVISTDETTAVGSSTDRTSSDPISEYYSEEELILNSAPALPEAFISSYATVTSIRETTLLISSTSDLETVQVSTFFTKEIEPASVESYLSTRASLGTTTGNHGHPVAKDTSNGYVTTQRTTESNLHCLCPCRQTSLPPNVPQAEKNEMIQAIIRNLSKSKDSLSSTVRKRTSAHDHRPSSKGIGALAVVFLSLVFGSVIVSDFPLLAQEIRNRLFNRQSN